MLTGSQQDTELLGVSSQHNAGERIHDNQSHAIMINHDNIENNTTGGFNMRYVTVTMILATALFLFAGCPGVEKPPTQTGDAVVNWSIKKAMSAKDAEDYLALFTGHPQLERKMRDEEKRTRAYEIQETVNYHNIDLSRIKDLKSTPERNSNPASYALNGTFIYSGPVILKGKEMDVPAGGTGTMYAWAKQKKNGSWYLHKLTFKLDMKTAIATMDASEKAER